MKNIIKSCVFVLIFIVLIEVLNCVFVPGEGIVSLKSLKFSTYDIVSEKENTIDIIALGDSVVYSSLSPMEIWNNHGYTSFDCAQPAQMISVAYEYLEAALSNQKPKMLLLEASMLFRNPSKQNIKNRFSAEVKKYLPLIKYHDNWKNYLSDGSKDNWVNVYKGYKYIYKIKGIKKNSNYMKYTESEVDIPQENIDYFNKIVDICQENGIKLVIISFPNRYNWDYKNHNTISRLASDNDVEFLDLNLVDLKINWKNDTKDAGKHLNYYGAKKVSEYVGNYLKDTNLFVDHRNDQNYELWNKAYSIYEKALNSN